MHRMYAQGPFGRHPVYTEISMLTHHTVCNLRYADPTAKLEGQLYALVDHAGIPGLARRLTKMDAEWVSLFEGSRDAGALEVAPILFPVYEDENKNGWKALFDWISEIGQYSTSVLLMVSPLPMRELASRLARRLDAKLPDAIEIFLRYFDTRIFEQLLVTLAQDQRASFLGIANCWWFLDRSGEIRQVAATLLEENLAFVPLKFTQEQQDELLDACEPDQIAALLQEFVPHEFNNLAPENRHYFIIRQMEIARNFGITLTHEIALFCALTLMHGEDFTNEERWSQIMSSVQAGKISLTIAVENVELDCTVGETT